MTVELLPDWRTCLWQWLTEQDEVSDLVADRIYSELPNSKTFPLVRLSLIGDPPITPGHYAVRALFQFDVWGGPQSLTWTVADTIRALLATRITGEQNVPAGTFVAGGVRCGGIRRTTEPIGSQGTEGDAEVTRHRPRCTFDASLVLHRIAGSGS